MSDYFDKDGTPMTLMEWAAKFEDFDYKVVASDNGKIYQVSTIWLGINHNFADDGPPLIFESMVFPLDSYEDQDCRRYATEAEALAGHDELVSEWLVNEPVYAEPDPED